MKIVVITALAALLFGGAATAGAAGTSVSTGSLVHISRAGATEWNFEALLRETFGSRAICSIASKHGAPIDFPKNDHQCVPLATYTPWIFDFTALGKSSFHLTSRDYTPEGWVANAPPVLIGGKLIACNKSGSQVLMGYSDQPADAIECAANPYITKF